MLGLGVLAPFRDHYLHLGILSKSHRGCDSCVVSFPPLLVFYTVCGGNTGRWAPDCCHYLLLPGGPHVVLLNDSSYHKRTVSTDQIPYIAIVKLANIYWGLTMHHPCPKCFICINILKYQVGTSLFIFYRETEKLDQLAHVITHHLCRVSR